MKFDLGDKAKVAVYPSNGNMYKVVEINLAYKVYLVECIDYYGPECLGDGSMTYGYGHQVWVDATCFDYVCEKL